MEKILKDNEDMSYKELMIFIIDSAGIDVIEKMGIDGTFYKPLKEDDIYTIKDELIDKIIEEVKD